MIRIDTIRTLRQTVERLGDGELRTDMLGRVAAVEAEFVAVDRRLRDKQTEIEGLRAQLTAHGTRSPGSTPLVYDPPV